MWALKISENNYKWVNRLISVRFSSNFRDFGCVVVGANMGLQKMTKEHIGLCLFLKIPFFVIITKIDMAPQNKYE